MNGSRSPDNPPTRESPRLTRHSPSRERKRDARAQDGAAQDEEDESEAETLIESPVKRREAERLAKVNTERTQQHRIGGLPVPAEGDDEADSVVSPVPSTEISIERPTPNTSVKAEDLDRMDTEGEDDDGSDPLSTPDASCSRAGSEQPNHSQSPNPRKRKHRASSAGLPNKRRDLEGTRRATHGPPSEAARNGKSLSPKARNHRRAVSTQSAVLDRSTDATSRKRRSVTHGSSRETKASKANWEESDGSSEATSHDHLEGKMPRRGIGRSTSTPGRPSGREHKRRINRYGFTKLAEGCETGNLDQVKLWREKDPDQLEIAEFAGNKPLQIAALAGNIEVVEYLIEQGCQIDCANQDKDTPLIDAAENGHIDVVKSLLNAGVDPLRQNLKGRTALDVVKDETDDADQIRAVLKQAIEKWNSSGARQKREEEEEQRHRAGPTKELHFMARTYENLLRLVQDNNRNGVREFLLARVPVDNAIIAAAAKTGDLYLLNMLLAEMPEKKRVSKPEKPMLSVLGTSHFDMVKSLTELDQFDPVWKDRRGRTWTEIAEDRNGPMVREEKELLQKLFNEAQRKERQSSSPVSRRDGGKRRPAHATSEDDSDEDVTPRRAGKRRLMSRRDIRANGKSRPEDESEGDEDDDDSGSDSANEAEENDSHATGQKQAGSPNASKQRTRPRPTQASDNDIAAHPRNSHQSAPDAEKVRTSELASRESAASETPSNVKVEAEESTDAAAEEIAKIVAQRTADEAAATVKRAAEEKARKEEEMRLAEEKERKLKAEEEERRKEAEKRAAEEARIEEERKANEQKALAKRSRDASLLCGLPAPIAHALDPRSGFNYDGLASAEYILHHFTPIQVLQQDQGADASLWVLNAQVAPLVGPVGLELMFQPDQIGYSGSLADTWTTKAVEDQHAAAMEQLLSNLPQILPPPPSDTEPTFDEMMQHGAEQLRAVADARKRLAKHNIALRYVRWDQVLDNLQPALKEVEFDVRFDYFQYSPHVASPTKGKFASESDFVEIANEVAQRRPLPRRYKGPRRVDAALEPVVVVGRTKVTVIHQK